MKLSELYSILNKVLEDKVFYATNVYDNEDNASMPFIVYQEISKRPSSYSDDTYVYYRSSVQITLVSKKKDLDLEYRLEQALLENGLVFSLLSESKNSDRSISRIYEIYMEEI